MKTLFMKTQKKYFMDIKIEDGIEVVMISVEAVVAVVAAAAAVVDFATEAEVPVVHHPIQILKAHVTFVKASITGLPIVLIKTNKIKKYTYNILLNMLT